MPERLKSIFNVWRYYIIFLSGALVLGVVVAGFALATDTAQEISFSIFRQLKLSPLLISPLTFAFSVWLILRYCPAASGSGVPQTIAAQHLSSRADRAHLLGLPVVAIKIFLVILVLLGGASMGREGPSVQIGAAIMLFFANTIQAQDKRIFIMAGSAAGIAAAFNTPLAGIAFLMEEMARGTSYKNPLTILAVILFAGMAAIGVTGNYDYFGYIKSEISVNHNWLHIITIAVVCGFSASLFNLMIIDGRKYICQMFGGFGKKRPVIFAAICGLLVALLGIACGGITFGSGYEIGHALLHGETTPEWWHPFAKMAATILSVISGIPGGTISPSLSIGATIGGALMPFFPNTPIPIIILLAMAGYFSAFTQSPITAAVIVLEITGKATAAIPLLVVALLAASVSRILFPLSVFHLMADTIMTDLKKKEQADDISHYDA